jgi:hypothetical protein
MICTESRDRTPLSLEIIRPEKLLSWESFVFPAVGIGLLVFTFLLGFGISLTVSNDVLLSPPPIPVPTPLVAAPTPISNAIAAK